MAPFATPARIRRQYYESENLDSSTSLPETSALAAPQTTAGTTPAPQPRPFPLTAPAIVGIACAVLLLIGAGLLLWRRRARVKEIGRLRKFEISVEKYGAGHGIANPTVRHSIQKVDLPKSFFDTDEEEDTPKRKSKLNFRLSSKAPPKSPVMPRSPKSMHQYFHEPSPPEPMPVGAAQMQQAPSSVVSVQTVGRPAAPLRVINGAPEPWTPASPSILAASVGSTWLSDQPALPPAAAFPPKLTLEVPSIPPPRRSSLVDPTIIEKAVAPRELPNPPPGPSPNYSPPSAASKPRKLPTPPHPPPTLFNYASKYTQNQDSSRPGSANSQNSPTLPRLMTAINRFTPTLNDELALQVGDTVRIIDEYRDGWCLVQHVGRMDSPQGVVPVVCLQERKRIVPSPGAATLSHKRSNGSLTNGFSSHR